MIIIVIFISGCGNRDKLQYKKLYRFLPQQEIIDWIQDLVVLLFSIERESQTAVNY